MGSARPDTHYNDESLHRSRNMRPPASPGDPIDVISQLKWSTRTTFRRRAQYMSRLSDLLQMTLPILAHLVSERRWASLLRPRQFIICQNANRAHRVYDLVESRLGPTVGSPGPANTTNEITLASWEGRYARLIELWLIPKVSNYLVSYIGYLAATIKHHATSKRTQRVPEFDAELFSGVLDVDAPTILVEVFTQFAEERANART